MNAETMDRNDHTSVKQDPRSELRDLYENWFNGNLATTALALGRTEAEIDGALAGDTIDEDLLMKVRRIKDERQSTA